MERRRRWERDAVSPPPTRHPPPTAVTPSPFLRDVSNFRTPKSHLLNPNPRPPSSPLPIFFSASKQTPSSFASEAIRLRGTSSRAAASRCEASRRRLKALELEQSQSSRKNQVRREKALKSFSGSISAWLNFLFENPSSCGCHTPSWSRDNQDGVSSSGKRESFDGGVVGGIEAGGRWRSPKRQRNSSWRGTPDENEVRRKSAMLSSLKVSLKEVCSLEDTKERMELYMSKKSCKEVLFMMNQACKNIDEGRLKIKSNCPLVTDLGIKEKATKTLMCYNPMWLRIGLHIIFGGDSLLINEEEKSDQEFQFLKIILEKQFFSHLDIAKSYAYNKLVEGIYKPGYYEALGGIILKRFLLLVVSLDKAKGECTLPTKYGIDGVDGGSPLLFCHHSHIKSSQQVVSEFLSEVMHGEGNLLGHLQTLGFKVNHQQIAISEYDYNVKILFEDIQDGIRLSRAIQLLQNDASILSKLMAPPDTRKKKLHNCTYVIKHLKLAGVSLCDADGTQILSEDIVNGDKELTLSLLWNIFVNLQVPLLIERASLVREITELKASHMENPDYSSSTMLGKLLEWIQVVCERYDIKVDGFSSLLDGKALCCLIHHYSNADFHGEFSSKENQGNNKGLFRHFDIGRTSAFHNLHLVQHIATMIGNFPEVFAKSELLDGDASLDERSVIILLTFLASLLICRKDLDLVKMRSLMRSDWMTDTTLSTSSWSAISENGVFTKSKSSTKTMLTISSPMKKRWLHKSDTEEWAVRVIQSHIRRFVERNKFLKIKKATSILQTAIRGWLTVVIGRNSYDVRIGCSISLSCTGQHGQYLKFMIERHKFIHIKKSVQLIQSAVRAWILRKHQTAKITASEHIKFSDNREPIYVEWESLQQQAMAVTLIQSSWRGFTWRKNLLVTRYATIKIQSHWRAWYARTYFLNMVKSATKIQAYVRRMLCLKSFKYCHLAATVIQQFIRGHLARNTLLGASSLRSSKLQFGLSNMTNSGLVKYSELKIVIYAVLRIQRWWKQFLLSRRQFMAAITVQSFVRGWHARKAAKKLQHSIFTIQRWWRFILFRELRRRSVLIIQAHVRGWIARRAISSNKYCIALIQSHWRCYLDRKRSRQQGFNLPSKIKNSQANVECDMQLINRLVAALPELFGCKSISNLRRTCAMLSSATEDSQRCCETLVAAGAIDILLKQIHTLNRGIPDQEILKHVLSTLRNIVHYPLLLQEFLNAPQWGEIIFQEVLRNKNEGYFIACDLLKKLCSTPEGRETICKLQTYVRRLNALVRDLERKVELQRRNACQASRKDITTRRVGEAADLLMLILGHRG